MLEDGLGQHIAACRPAVTQNAVVEQVVSRAVANAQQRRIEGLCARLAHFEMPDIGGERGKAHGGVDVAVGVEGSLTQGVEAEAATTFPAHGFADAAMLTVDDFLQARDAMRAGVVTHLNADPAAAHLVGHGGCGAGAEEGVEDEVAGVGGDVDDAVEKAFGLGRTKGSLMVKEGQDFLLGFLCVADILR